MATLKFLLIFTVLTLLRKLHVNASTNTTRRLSAHSISSLRWNRYAEEAGVGFGARLIHWSNPESPFYEPYASSVDILKSAARSSRARGKYLQNIISINNFKDPRKYPISAISFTDKNIVMSFSVGSDPPLNTYAIPDTGSSLMWIQCEPCSVCHKQSVPLYNPDKSSTFSDIPCYHPDCGIALGGQMPKDCESSTLTCNFNLEYDDGSKSQGEIVSDTMRFEANDKRFGKYFELKHALFGCGRNNTLQKGEDPSKPFSPGIIGLSNHTGSLIRQLNLGLFSYCISENAIIAPGARDDTSQIRFGLAASVSGSVSTALAPLNHYGWYFFRNVDGIYVDNEKLTGYPEWVFQYVEGGLGGLMIDSGTTYTTLYPLVFDALVGKIKEIMYSKSKLRAEKDKSILGWSLCYNDDDLKTVDLPEIEFRFTDSVYGIPYRFKNYWIYNYARQSCLAIDRGDHGISILGEQQLHDVKVGFDLMRNFVTFSNGFGCPQYHS